MIIDIHIHCYPDEIASRAIEARSEKFGIKPVTDGTVNGIKKSMEKSNVDYSVIQSIAINPLKNHDINYWTKSKQDDSILTFGTVHPDYSEWKAEIRWLIDNNFKGVKVHADCQGYLVDDAKMLNVYEEIFSRGLPILFHSGRDLAFETSSSTPKRLRKVVDTFPKAKIIVAHMGGYKYWEEAEEYLVGSDVYFDTAYSIHELGQDRASKFIKKHGADKVLFGTDSPWREQEEDISLIKSLDLSKEEIDGILGNNAKRLLKL